MKKAVVYARYSSERQTEQSIEGQLHVCQDYATKNDICIVDTYIDRAMTGTNDLRDGFQKMMRDSAKQAWDIVLVYKLDRFSRDKYEIAMHRHTLRSYGIKLISAMENIPDTPEGIILESLIEGMNQYYSAELSQKVRRGMKESRLKGNFTGGYVLYGYKVDNKKLVIDEDSANVVRYIFSEYASGRLVTDILTEIRAKGLLNHGRPFARTTLYRILSNEKYSGTYHYKDEVFNNIYPRIVPEEIYEAVKTKLEDNKYGKHVENVYYLLKNKLFCGYCGGIVNSDAGTSRLGDVKRYYKCSSKRKNKTCSLKAIRKELIEKLIVDTLLKTMSDKMINIFADKIIAFNEMKIQDHSVINQLMNTYNEIEKSINNVLTAIENGISTSSTKKRLEDLEDKKFEISSKIACEQNKERFTITKNDILKYIKKAIQKDPRQLFKLLVKKVILFNDKVEIYLNYTTNKTPDDGNDHQELFLLSINRTMEFIFRYDCKPEYVNYEFIFKCIP